VRDRVLRRSDAKGAVDAFGGREKITSRKASLSEVKWLDDLSNALTEEKNMVYLNGGSRKKKIRRVGKSHSPEREKFPRPESKTP